MSTKPSSKSDTIDIRGKKPKQRYHRITALTVARFRAAELELGNGAEAVRQIEPDYRDESLAVAQRRAYLIRMKADDFDSQGYIDHAIQKIGVSAIERIDEMVQSPDERIATKNAHFVVEHVRGKAIQRSENKNFNLNIDAILD